MNNGAVAYLGFWERFVPELLDGTKTVTIRRKSSRTPKPGATIELRFKRRTFATAVVLDVVKFRIVDAPYWARQDGHASGTALVRELRRLYGPVGDLVVIVLCDVRPIVADVDVKGELL